MFFLLHHRTAPDPWGSPEKSDAVAFRGSATPFRFDQKMGPEGDLIIEYRYIYIYIYWLVVYLPLRKYEFVSWNDYFQYMGKQCSKPPASMYIYTYIYSEGTCPRRLLYHLFEAPVLGPWAHLGFEKKRPQSLNKRPTKA